MRFITKAQWERSKMELTEFLGPKPCRVDEALAMYVAEVTAAHYCDHNFIQGGEPERQIGNGPIYLHLTFLFVDGINDEPGAYYWVGALPAFKTTF